MRYNQSFLGALSLVLMATPALADFYVIGGTRSSSGTISGGPPFTTVEQLMGIYPVQLPFDASDISDYNAVRSGTLDVSGGQFDVYIPAGKCGQAGEVTATLVPIGVGVESFDLVVDGVSRGNCVSDESQVTNELTGCCPQNTQFVSIYRCATDLCSGE